MNVKVVEPEQGVRLGILWRRFCNSIPSCRDIIVLGCKEIITSAQPLFDLLLIYCNTDCNAWFNQMTNIEIMDGPWGEDEYRCILDNLIVENNQIERESQFRSETKWGRYVYWLLKTASIHDRCLISMSIDMRDSLIESAPDTIARDNG